MCHFVSWKEKDEQVFFLTNKDLKGRKFSEFKRENERWREDICGHGAIEWFYPELKTVPNKECTNFSTSENFPKVIVSAIKKLELTKIGYNLELLNTEGKKEYEKIRQSAWEEYEKIEQPALEKYQKIQRSAWEEYEKIQRSAWEKYKKIQQPALEEYQKIKQSAWEEYEKIRQSAWEEYEKIEQPALEKYQKIQRSALEEYEKIQQPALEEYEKIQQPAFWLIFKQKKYRNPNWV